MLPELGANGWTGMMRKEYVRTLSGLAGRPRDRLQPANRRRRTWRSAENNRRGAVPGSSSPYSRQDVAETDPRHCRLISQIGWS